MKKRPLSGLFALALLATTAVGVAESKKSEAGLSDLAMANIEALSQSETGDEFYEATGCYACICQTNCTGKDGRTYKHASSTKP